VVSRVLRLSSCSPGFLLSPPFVVSSSLLVAVSSSRLVKKEHCRFLRRVHFSCAVFFVLKCFLFFCGEVKGREREEGIEFRYA
jgi:hypothetical protein